MSIRFDQPAVLRGGKKMAFAPMPDTNLLRSLIDYNPSTGALIWKDRPKTLFATTREWRRWNNRYSGHRCFNSPTESGYLHGALFKRLYLAHRVAWKIYHGEEPQLIVDHKNCDRSDNRADNLRSANFTANIGNRTHMEGCSSRFRGVSRYTDGRRWVAYCSGQWIGLFDDEIEAAKAANDRMTEHFGEFAKLNIIEGYQT